MADESPSTTARLGSNSPDYSKRTGGSGGRSPGQVRWNRQGSGGIAQLVGCLLSMHKVLGSIPSTSIKKEKKEKKEQIDYLRIWNNDCQAFNRSVNALGVNKQSIHRKLSKWKERKELMPRKQTSIEKQIITILYLTQQWIIFSHNGVNIKYWLNWKL